MCSAVGVVHQAIELNQQGTKTGLERESHIKATRLWRTEAAEEAGQGEAGRGRRREGTDKAEAGMYEGEEAGGIKEVHRQAGEAGRGVLGGDQKRARRRGAGAGRGPCPEVVVGRSKVGQEVAEVTIGAEVGREEAGESLTAATTSSRWDAGRNQSTSTA